MRIALDAMGGDFGPSVLVDGAVSAARDLPAVQKLFLVGDRSALETELARYRDLPASLEIVHAPEVVGMDEAPTVALRKKKDSSITQAVELVKKGEAEAVFSAGSTGAAVAVSTVKLRTLEGIDQASCTQ